jgi:hypothetical protein
MYFLLFLTTSAPSVPLQHLFPALSVLFPPDVPSMTAPPCVFWFGDATTVTIIDPLSAEFACDTAVIVVGMGVPSLLLVAALGATKSPALEINPVAWLPPVTPPTCQVTPILVLPVTVAVNCSVPNTLTVCDGALTVTVTLCCTL